METPQEPDGDWAIRPLMENRILWNPSTRGAGNAESLKPPRWSQAGNSMNESSKKRLTQKRNKSGYQVTVRGTLPADLVERVSALHAAAILRKLEKASSSGEIEPGIPKGKRNLVKEV